MQEEAHDRQLVQTLGSLLDFGDVVAADSPPI